jgi:hypothetical protein
VKSDGKERSVMGFGAPLSSVTGLVKIASLFALFTECF